MAIGDTLFLADKATLDLIKTTTDNTKITTDNTKITTDNIKTTTDNIKTTTDKAFENKTTGILVGSTTFTVANTYKDIISIIGNGFVTGLEWKEFNTSGLGYTNTHQLLIDGITYAWDSGISPMSYALPGLIKFDSSFKLQIKSTGITSDSGVKYKCTYLV